MISISSEACRRDLESKGSVGTQGHGKVTDGACVHRSDPEPLATRSYQHVGRRRAAVDARHAVHLRKHPPADRLLTRAALPWQTPADPDLSRDRQGAVIRGISHTCSTLSRFRRGAHRFPTRCVIVAEQFLRLFFSPTYSLRSTAYNLRGPLRPFKLWLRPRGRAMQSGRAARAPGDDIPLGALVSGNRWERGRLVRRRLEMSDSSAEALRDSTLPWPWVGTHDVLPANPNPDLMRPSATS